MWVSRRWRGNITNLQPEEHDAIAWLGEGQPGELTYAGPSYPDLLASLLSD